MAPAPRFLDRELSWLGFTARVLAVAGDRSQPLLERVKFAAIVATNLDEFFMLRVAALQRQGEAADVHDRAARIAAEHAALWRDLAPALATAGIRVARWDDLTDAERAGLAGLFVARVFPVLTPLAADPPHPFPAISSRSLNLAVLLREPGSGARRLAHVTVPPGLPRFVPVGGNAGTTLLPMEELVAANLARLFPGMEITGHHAFRVTRAAALDIDDDGADDRLRTVEEELRRHRVAPAVRLEVAEGTPSRIVETLAREMDLERAAVHRLPEPLGLADLWELHRLDRPDLRDESIVPSSLTDALMPDGANEVLVHHPYESFASSVQAFIERAADDPQVLAIKQTLYRTTADPIVNALVRAAQAGKQVVVLVELRARFDEANNVGWARMLERAGCQVMYGVPGLKTHAKLVLVVRREGTTVRRQVHVGTGNYNAATARTYEDLGLLSADPELAREVGELFNLLTGYARRSEAERLMVAPFDLRARLLARIAHEADTARAGAPARIVIKCNAITDPPLIEALYAASAAGVAVDLIVRGICTLRPGVPGLSERIRVRSIIGRFLEHSRILRFGTGAQAETWIGSADLMERNLDRRVEAAVRIDAPAQRERLGRLLDLALADTASAWSLNPDGTWSPPPDPEHGLALQPALLAGAEPADEPLGVPSVLRA